MRGENGITPHSVWDFSTAEWLERLCCNYVTRLVPTEHVGNKYLLLESFTLLILNSNL